MEFIKSFLSFINENKEEDFEDKIKGDGYFKGLSLSTSRKKAAALKKQAAMDDDDPAAYGPLPGDTKGKKLLKPSKHTKKYQELYGDEDETNEKQTLTEKKYYVTYNKGRGQGKGLEMEFDQKNFKSTDKPKVFNSYEDAKKYAEKMEKMFRNSIGGGTAYWVSDEKMNQIDEALNEDASMNKDVKSLLDKSLSGKAGSPPHLFAIKHILIGALTDANFHPEAKKVPALFPKAEFEPRAYGENAEEAIKMYEYEIGPQIARICQYDGGDIVDAIGFYVSKTIGKSVGEKIQKLVESVNEAELKLGVRYVNKQGKEGFIQTGGSTNPKNWFWSDGKTKHPYDKVKKELKPAKDQKKTGFSDYLKQGGRVWDNVNPSDSPPVNEETVYIDFLNKDKGFRPDRKYFKGKNAYDSAVKWAKNNFEKFNPDMIRYESMNEMSEDLLAEEYEALIVEKFSTITATGLTKKHKDDLIKMGANVKLSGPGWYIMVKTEDVKQALDYLEKEGIDVSESLNEKASGDRSPIDNDAVEKGLEKKSEETGVPVPLLRIVMRRGMAAWKSGRRPGAGQEQWGYARVNSFLTKGPGTWGRPLKDPVKGGPKGAYGADADVAKEVIDGGHDKKLK